MMNAHAQRGFTLLIAVILSSVVLTVGLTLLEVAYKQVILSSTAKQSQTAFYNADSALECALYYDQKFNAFDFTTPAPSSTLSCSSTPVTSYTTSADAAKRITIFTLPCTGSGTYATTTVYKYASGATALYANGFNTCNATDPRRIERGLKATYGVVGP
jgi:Tfp pilus assembly protein PilE